MTVVPSGLSFCITEGFLDGYRRKKMPGGWASGPRKEADNASPSQAWRCVSTLPAKTGGSEGVQKCVSFPALAFRILPVILGPVGRTSKVSQHRLRPTGSSGTLGLRVPAEGSGDLSTTQQEPHKTHGGHSSASWPLLTPGSSQPLSWPCGPPHRFHGPSRLRDLVDSSPPSWMTHLSYTPKGCEL